VDMLILRRFILGFDAQFRLVPHWVFIPQPYILPATPPQLSEILQSYYINPNALGNPSVYKFWAIKMGDVNNSYDATTDNIREVPTGQVQTRSEGLTLTTGNILLEEGTLYDIQLKVSKPTTCMGFQGSFCLKNGSVIARNEATEGSSLLNLESETLQNFDENNFNASKNGQITFSWNAAKNHQFDPNTPLLTLRFKAPKSGHLSDILQLNSTITPALSFDETGIEKSLSLKFENKEPNFTVEAQPNPFSDVLTVKIGQNTEGSLSYSIFDNSGKLMHKNQAQLKKGTSILTLNAASMNVIQAGIYFLKIETSEGVKTIKIIKV
jgi:Secretion system C-terminal sorting domain